MARRMCCVEQSHPSLPLRLAWVLKMYSPPRRKRRWTIPSAVPAVDLPHAARMDAPPASTMTLAAALDAVLTAASFVWWPWLHAVPSEPLRKFLPPPPHAHLADSDLRMLTFQTPIVKSRQQKSTTKFSHFFCTLQHALAPRQKSMYRIHNAKLDLHARRALRPCSWARRSAADAGAGRAAPRRPR